MDIKWTGENILIQKLNFKRFKYLLRYGCPTCECKETQPPMECYENLEFGDCNKGVKRFYYNKFTGFCEPFVYEGCNGNNNNFLTLEDCQKKCSKLSCPIPSCAVSCEYGYAYTENGCQTCTCADGYACKDVKCAENWACVALPTNNHPKFTCQPKDRGIKN